MVDGTAGQERRGWWPSVESTWLRPPPRCPEEMKRQKIEGTTNVCMHGKVTVAAYNPIARHAPVPASVHVLCNGGRDDGGPPAADACCLAPAGPAPVPYRPHLAGAPPPPTPPLVRPVILNSQVLVTRPPIITVPALGPLHLPVTPPILPYQPPPISNGNVSTDRVRSHQMSDAVSHCLLAEEASPLNSVAASEPLSVAAGGPSSIDGYFVVQGDQGTMTDLPPELEVEAQADRLLELLGPETALDAHTCLSVLRCKRWGTRGIGEGCAFPCVI